MIDEDLAEYQHKTGVLNIKYAVRHYVKARDHARCEQLRRELLQQCEELSRGLNSSASRKTRREENVSPRAPR